MRELTRGSTFTTRVLLEQRELYKIADRDHMLAPCTPLKTSPIGASPRPRLKMTQSKVWSYWSASHRSSAVGCQRTAVLNLGEQTSSFLMALREPETCVEYNCLLTSKLVQAVWE